MVKIGWLDTAQIAILKRAIEDEDWFTAVVLSATQLERHGYLEIKAYFESLEVNSGLLDRVLDRMYLHQIAGCLFAIGTIDKKKYETVIEINKTRNKFLHRREKEEFERGAEAKRRYEPLVKEAIRILRERLPTKHLFIMK